MQTNSIKGGIRRCQQNHGRGVEWIAIWVQPLRS